jgi:hypothetical protein
MELILCFVLEDYEGFFCEFRKLEDLEEIFEWFRKLGILVSFFGLKSGEYRGFLVKNFFVWIM